MKKLSHQYKDKPVERHIKSHHKINTTRRVKFIPKELVKFKEAPIQSNTENKKYKTPNKNTR